MFQDASSNLIEGLNSNLDPSNQKFMEHIKKYFKIYSKYLILIGILFIGNHAHAYTFVPSAQGAFNYIIQAHNGSNPCPNFSQAKWGYSPGDNSFTTLQGNLGSYSPATLACQDNGGDTGSNIINLFGSTGAIPIGTDIYFTENSGIYYMAIQKTGTNSFNFYTNPPVPPVVKNGWIDPYTPATGSYSSSTPVTFSANYFYDCITPYDLVNFEFKDLTIGEQSFNTPPNTINACGQSNLMSSVNLVTTHQYLWRPVMYSTTASSTTIYGNYYSFLATSTPNWTQLPQFVNGTVGTSTLLDTTNFLSFINIPNLLTTKIPFGYIFEVKDVIFNAISTTTASSIPTGTISIPWPTGTHGATTSMSVDLFSTSTITYFLGPTNLSYIRGMMVAIIYISGMFWIYRMILTKKNL